MEKELLYKDKEELSGLILKGEFDKAIDLCREWDFSRKADSLLLIAWDDNSDLSAYLFVMKLICEKETGEFQYLASSLMTSPYSWVKGGYSLGMGHLKRALELEPDNIDYKLAMLFYYEIPEKLLSLEEAKMYALDLVKSYPEHKGVLDILKK